MSYAFVSMVLGVLFFVVLGGIISFIEMIQNKEAKKK